MTKSHTYILKNLPEEIQEILLSSYHAKNINEHRNILEQNKFYKKNDNDDVTDLFSSFIADDFQEEKSVIEFVNDRVVWATDNYTDKSDLYNFDQPIHDLSVIIPRVEKVRLNKNVVLKKK